MANLEDGNLQLSQSEDGQIDLDGFPAGGKAKRYRRIKVRVATPNAVTIRKNYPLINSLSASLQTNSQQKLLNIIIKCVQTQTPNKQGFWSIPFSDLKVALNMSTNNRTHIAQVANSMQKIRMHFDIEQEDLNNPKLAWIVCVPTILYEQGQILFKINSDIEHLFSKDHRYALMEEREMASLRLQCSVPLYELACQYAGIQHSSLMPWELLRGLIMAREIPKKAETWSGFSERYLIPSINEVSQQTKYNIELDVIKRGKFIDKVRLIIKPKGSRQEVLSGLSESQAHAQMRGFLEKWPLTNPDILNLFGKHKIEDIQAAYAHTLYRAKFEKYQLKYPHRYFIRSLENGYYREYPDCAKVMGIVFVTPSPAVAKTQANETNVEDTVTNAQIEEFVMARRKQSAIADLEAMTTEAKHACFKEYNATLTNDKLALNIGRRNGHGNMVLFHTWYIKQYYGEITPDEREMAKQEILANQRNLTLGAA
ncbi:replication initiation protein [Comamonas sp. w2-DMI]|uniref:replication initiation protein n=1 Tax=Comamonas sp. w2-DMI TaxID=3126391 RepID=UPI0032E41BAD